MIYFARWQKVALIVLTLALLSGGGALLYAKGRIASLDDGAPFFVDAPAGQRRTASMLIDVSGAVANPGLYRLAAGARINEAISIAGGTTDQADLQAVNLAGKLRDGEKVVVPTKPETPPAVASTPPNPHSFSGPKPLPNKPVPLNAATTEQLQQLPGIGPVLAQRILQHRQRLKTETGKGFQAKEQLLEVPGIGPKKYAEMKDFVSL